MTKPARSASATQTFKGMKREKEDRWRSSPDAAMRFQIHDPVDSSQMKYHKSESDPATPDPLRSAEASFMPERHFQVKTTADSPSPEGKRAATR
ncbi:MAG: hypothetical protein ACXWUB_04700 [Burkholderiales bacterium]